MEKEEDAKEDDDDEDIEKEEDGEETENKKDSEEIDDEEELKENIEEEPVSEFIVFSDGTFFDVATAEDLCEAVEQASDGDTINITVSEIQLEEPLEIDKSLKFVSETEAVLKSNTGISAAGNAGRHMIIANGVNSSLEFENIKLDGGSRTGGIYISGGSIVSIEGNGVFYQNYNGDRGGAIYGEDAVTLNIHGEIQFINNEALNFGGAICVSNSKLSIEGSVTFEKNEARDSGGAIYGREGSEVEINGDSVVFKQNKAKYYGGAIYGYGSNSTNACIIRVKGSVEFSENIVTNTNSYGGAIYLNRTDLYITGGVKFKGNSAVVSGGAIYGGNGIVIEIVGDTIEFIENTTPGNGAAIRIYNDVALSIAGTVNFIGNEGNGYYGGAIYAEDSQDLKIEGTVLFSENKMASTTGYGGAMCISNTNLSIEGAVVFEKNEAGHSGGAVYAKMGSEVEINGDSVVFEQNKANYYGGAIYGYGSNSTNACIIRVKGSVEFSENIVTNTNSYGGAIYLNRTDLYVSDRVKFHGNEAVATGGAIYGGNGIKIEIIGDTVDFIENTTPGNAGAICIYNDVELSIAGTVNFIGNEGNGYYGGAIYADSAKGVKIEGTVAFSENKIINGTGYGGAICAYETDLTIKGAVTFKENEAGNSGGAIYGKAGSAVEINGEIVEFIGNKAASSGGAIYMFNDVDMSIKNKVKFENNIANGFGGAIYANQSNGLSIEGEDIQFIGNEARGEIGYGGAVAVAATDLNMNGAIKWESNESERNGGAIYAKAGSEIQIKADRIEFNSNKAEGTGGAIYVYNDPELYNITPVQIKGKGVFYGNKVVNSKSSGGAIAVEYVDLEISGDINFQENNSINRAGAVYIYNSKLEISENVQFINNEAFGYGGAMWVGNNSNVLIKDNVKFIGNRAVNDNIGEESVGGAIYMLNQGGLNIEGQVEFRENESVSSGGAIYTIDDVDLKIKDHVQFVGNKSGMDGGAIIVSNGSEALIENEVLFKRNSAVNHGGAIDTGWRNDDGSKQPKVFIQDDVQFIQNSADEGGGAIYAYAEAIVDIGGNVQFTENETLTDGGAIYIEFDSILTANDNVRFIENKALSGNGGAVYTELLDNVSVGKDAAFENNRASFAVKTISAQDLNIHREKVKTDKFSYGFEVGYNNFDINCLSVVDGKYYLVDFETYGGNPIPDIQILKEGEMVTRPSAITRSEHTFVNWLTASNRIWNFNTNTVTENMTLYAQWKGSDPYDEGSGKNDPDDRDGSGTDGGTGGKTIKPKPDSGQDPKVEAVFEESDDEPEISQEYVIMSEETRVNSVLEPLVAEMIHDDELMDIDIFGEKLDPLSSGNEKSNPITGYVVSWKPFGLSGISVGGIYLLLRKRNLLHRAYK